MLNNLPYFRRLSFWLVKKYRHSTIPQTYVLLMDVALFVAAFFAMEMFRSFGAEEFSSRGVLVKFITSLKVHIIP